MCSTKNVITALSHRTRGRFVNTEQVKDSWNNLGALTGGNPDNPFNNIPDKDMNWENHFRYEQQNCGNQRLFIQDPRFMQAEHAFCEQYNQIPPFQYSRREISVARPPNGVHPQDARYPRGLIRYPSINAYNRKTPSLRECRPHRHIIAKPQVKRLQYSPDPLSVYSTSTRHIPECKNEKLNGRIQNRNRDTHNVVSGEKVVAAKKQQEGDNKTDKVDNKQKEDNEAADQGQNNKKEANKIEKVENKPKENNKTIQNKQKEDNSSDKIVNKGHDSKTDKVVNEQKGEDNTVVRTENAQEDNKEDDNKTDEECVEKSANSSIVSMDLVSDDDDEIIQVEDHDESLPKEPEITKNQEEIVLNISNPKKITHALDESTKKKENKDDQGNITKSGSDNSTDISISTATLLNNIALITETLTNIHELEKKKSPKTVEPEAKSRDPRLQKKCREEPIGTNADTPSDPRNIRKVCGSVRFSPLELKVPSFWTHRCRQKLKAKSSGTELVAVRKSSIKKKSHVCFKNLSELNEYGKIPIKQFSKYCCHVNIRRNECKYAPFQTISDECFQSMIDTKKSYLIEKTAAQETPNNNENKKETEKDSTVKQSHVAGSKTKLAVSDKDEIDKKKSGTINKRKSVCRHRHHRINSVKSSHSHDKLHPAGSTKKKLHIKEASKMVRIPSSVKVVSSSSILNRSLSQKIKSSKTEKTMKKLEKSTPLKRKRVESPKITKRIRTRADIDALFEYKTPPVLKFIQPFRKETEEKSADILKPKHIISGVGTIQKTLSQQLEEITNPDKDKEQSAYLNRKSTTSTPCRDENEDDMEYSLHIPEGGTHTVTTGMEMSSEELIRALEQSIDGISSRISSSEYTQTSEEKNQKLDETISDSSSSTIPMSDRAESAAEVTESDSINTTDTDGSPHAASISHGSDEGCEQGDEEKLEDDEGEDIQIQVRVIDNPEVKKEAEESLPPIIDLFAVQAAVKREDGATKNDEIEAESISMIRRELEADNRRDSNVDREDGETRQSYTFTVPVGTTDCANIRLPPKKFGGYRRDLQTPTEPVGHEDTSAPTINIQCVYTRDTDSTDTVENQNDSFPEVRLSISVVTENVPGDISTSTSDSSSEDLSSTTNRQETAAQNDTNIIRINKTKPDENLQSHNNVPVENEQNTTLSTSHSTDSTMTSPIVDSGTIADGQENVSNSSSVPTPLEPPRPLPRMSNISEATSNPQEGGSFPQTKKYVNIACKIFKILNSYISTTNKLGYVAGTLEYLQPTYNIATDKKNIDAMISNMRFMFGCMLLNCLLGLPPNIQRIDVFLNCLMGLLFRAMQNEKLMPYPTKYMWELVSVHSKEYERNLTLKTFRNYIENDVRRHQQLISGFSMTFQQHYVLKAQIYQYLHLRNESIRRQGGVVGTNRQTVIRTAPQNISSKPNNVHKVPNQPVCATRDMTDNCQASCVDGRNLQCSAAANSIGSANFRSNTQQAAKIAKMNHAFIPQNVQSQNNSTSKILRQILNAPVNTSPLPSPNVNSSITNRIYSPNTSGKSPNNDSATFPTYSEHINNDTSRNAVTKPHHMQYPGVNGTGTTPMNMPVLSEVLISPGNAVNTRQNVPSTNVNSPRVVWSQNQGITSWNNNLGHCLRMPQINHCPNIDISKTNLSQLEQATLHNNTRQAQLVNNTRMNPSNLPTSPPTYNALNNGQTMVSNTRMSPMNLPTRSTAGNILNNMQTMVSNTMMNPTNLPTSAAADNIFGKNDQSSNVNHYVGALPNAQTPADSNTPRCNVESNGDVEGHQRSFELITPPSPAQKHKMDTPVNPTDSDVPTQKKRMCNRTGSSALDGSNSESLYPTPPLSNASSQRAISPPTSESSLLDARKNCDGDIISNETTGVPSLPSNDDLPKVAQSVEDQPDVKPFRSMFETMTFEHSVHLKDEDMEIIDLTWLDDELIKDEPFADDSCGTEEGDLTQSESLLILYNRECLCGKVAEYLCSCNTVMYCSEACQLEDWANHQKLCPSTSSEKNLV